MLRHECGVMARLKARVPTLIVIHCAAHRLALATSQTAAAFPLFVRFERILNQVFVFFSRSSVHSAELAEMQTVLNHPHLHLQRATITRWLSLDNAVNALRRCFRPVKAVLDQEASTGDATALGLVTELSKPEFIVVLFLLSDVLWTVAKLSTAFQCSSLNLLNVEKILDSSLSELVVLKGNVYLGGYMMQLRDEYPVEVAATDAVTFQAKAESYIERLVSNIKHRFPQVHALSLLGCLDPRNAPQAMPAQVLELAGEFGLEGPQLWNEFRSYQSLAATIEPQSLSAAMKCMWNPVDRDGMVAAYPLISKLLARIAGSAPSLLC